MISFFLQFFLLCPLVLHLAQIGVVFWHRFVVWPQSRQSWHIIGLSKYSKTFVLDCSPIIFRNFGGSFSLKSVDLTSQFYITVLHKLYILYSKCSFVFLMFFFEKPSSSFMAGSGVCFFLTKTNVCCFSSHVLKIKIVKHKFLSIQSMILFYKIQAVFCISRNDYKVKLLTRS